MAPVLFQIGDYSVYGYGVSMAVGVLISFICAMIRVRRYHMDEDLYYTGILSGIIAGICGAKILYWIVEWDYFMEDPKRFLDITNGFVFYGGAIFGVVAPYVYVRFIKKLTFVDKLDVVIPYLAIGQLFGRLGCLLAGCCYGKEAPEGAWYAITFPAGSEAPTGVGLYPVQILSMVGLALIFVILLLIARKQKFAGQIISTYMILYSIGRFLLEFLRDDDRGTVGPFSTSQFISILILLGGIIMFVYLSGKKIPIPSPKSPKKEAVPEKTPVEGEAPEAEETVEEGEAPVAEETVEEAEAPEEEETVEGAEAPEEETIEAEETPEDAETASPDIQESPEA